MFDASPHRELHAKVIPWIGAAENLTALQNDPLAEPGAPVRPQIASAGRLRGSFSKAGLVSAPAPCGCRKLGRGR